MSLDGSIYFIIDSLKGDNVTKQVLHKPEDPICERIKQHHSCHYGLDPLKSSETAIARAIRNSGTYQLSYVESVVKPKIVVVIH